MLKGVNADPIRQSVPILYMLFIQPDESPFVPYHVDFLLESDKIDEIVKFPLVQRNIVQFSEKSVSQKLCNVGAGDINAVSSIQLLNVLVVRSLRVPQEGLLLVRELIHSLMIPIIPFESRVEYSLEISKLLQDFVCVTC